MSNVNTLAAHLQTVLAEARESLGLPDVDLSSPEEMLAEAARISELVSSRMRTIDDQIGTLNVSRSAVRSYLRSEAPTPVG